MRRVDLCSCQTVSRSQCGCSVVQLRVLVVRDLVRLAGPGDLVLADDQPGAADDGRQEARLPLPSGLGEPAFLSIHARRGPVRAVSPVACHAGSSRGWPGAARNKPSARAPRAAPRRPAARSAVSSRRPSRPPSPDGSGQPRSAMMHPRGTVPSGDHSDSDTQMITRGRAPRSTTSAQAKPVWRAARRPELRGLRSPTVTLTFDEFPAPYVRR